MGHGPATRESAATPPARPALSGGSGPPTRGGPSQRAGERGGRGGAPRASPPVIVYDRDCGFCRWSLARLVAWDRRRRLRLVALQDPEAERLLPGMSARERFAAAHLVLPSGERYSGGDALVPLLRLLPGGSPLAVVARAVRAPARIGYGWVARNRALFGRPLSERTKARATARIDRHG